MAWQNNQTTGGDFVFLHQFHSTRAAWIPFSLTILALLLVPLTTSQHPHLDWPTRPPPHVFSAQPIVPHGPLYMSTFVPKMTLDFLSGDHHISLRHWVWHSAIPLHHLGGSRGPAAGRHGLQLLCGHLLPTVLFHPHLCATPSSSIWPSVSSCCLHLGWEHCSLPWPM